MRARAVVAICAAASYLAAQNLRPQPRNGIPLESHSHLLESCARTAAITGDKDSANALADAIIGVPHRFTIQPDIASLIKPHAVNAELSFWQGLHRGVDEADIVSLINAFADRFGLPEYVKTSASQVRILRMEGFLVNPIFLGRGMAQEKREVGQQIKSTMSPLQAIHVIQTLVDQKFLIRPIRSLLQNGTR
jgi:hypothetical protein